MPYNMWYLTPSRSASPAAEWVELVSEFGEGQCAELAEVAPDGWRRITAHYADGSWSFDFERKPVEAGNAEDLQFFRWRLDGAKPEVNARWVAEYLNTVRTVYTFRLSLSGPDTNLKLVNDIIDNLGSDDPSGLTYAEFEGWSNESGQNITWEFSDRITGEWWMALRREKGWVYFLIDAANPEHRRAFQAGEVPAGVESKEYSD